MKKLVKLPDGNYVNPDYVTAIELKSSEQHGKRRCLTHVWVVKDSGYGTGNFQYEGDRRDELALLLGGRRT